MGIVKIYTDGACSGNPGPGGWAAIVIHQSPENHPSKEVSANGKDLQAPKDDLGNLDLLDYADSVGDVEHVLTGNAPHTTNNQMEIQAAISSLKYISKHYSSNKNKVEVVMMTDSQYLQKGISEWIAKWKKNGWKTANRKPVLNQQMWQELDKYCELWQGKIQWQWVKAHDTDALNLRVDELARGVIEHA